jgi:hypothetical protein
MVRVMGVIFYIFCIGQPLKVIYVRGYIRFRVSYGLMVKVYND